MMVRVSHVEAQRVSAVLEEMKERLQFLESITPDVLAHRDELSQQVGDEISRIIHDQRDLEKRYEELIDQRQALKAMSNKTRYKENEQQLQQCAQQLRQITKDLMRNLKDNPNVAENLVKIQSERNKLQNLLDKTIRELNANMFNTLLATVDEEKLNHDNLLETIAREKEATQAVKTLQTELEKEKQDHDRDVHDRNDKISKLKEDLKKLRIDTTIETRYAHNEAKARCGATHRTYKAREDELDETIKRLRTKLEIERRVHSEVDTFLRWKLAQRNNQILDWENKQKDEKDQKDQEIADLKEAKKNNLQKLVWLSDLHKQWLSDKENRESEHKRLTDIRELEKKELLAMTEAAIMIQALWRGWWIRTGEKKKKGKKGKKGKGKKKK